MQIITLQIRRRGVTYIFIEALPKGRKTRSLLEQFKREVKALEKKFKAAAAAGQ
jgi:hypothetical protein